MLSSETRKDSPAVLPDDAVALAVPQAAWFVELSQTLQQRLLSVFLLRQSGFADLAACRCAGPQGRRRVALNCAYVYPSNSLGALD